MPASTRSRTKQVRLDDKEQLKKPVQHSKKRSAEDSVSSSAPKSKSVKTSSKSGQTASHETDNGAEVVIINRAPVLELWSASVTSFLHPRLSWQTCLSAGGAISAICAVSKGRAIGSIEQPGPDKAEQRREERRKAEENEQSQEIEVMQFHLTLNDGQALVSGKPRNANEGALKHKFGDHYDSTKELFQSSLKSWKGHEDDLSRKAFHMYEKFRPTVPAGQKGWGRRGELSFDMVKQSVNRPDT